MLIQRRTALDPRWHNRREFADATGLNYRVIYDAEEARRTNFGGSTLAAIEAAYRLEPGTITRFLSGAELAGEADQARQFTVAPPPEPDSVVPADGDLPPVLRGLDAQEIKPWLEEVDRDLAAVLAGESDPFDDFERGVLRDDRHSIDAKRVLIAIARMYRSGRPPGQPRARNAG
jgi:hypothetical protein